MAIVCERFLMNKTNRRIEFQLYYWYFEIPIIKLELNASLGFIHKESIAMHGHKILKKICERYFTVILIITIVLEL